MRIDFVYQKPQNNEQCHCMVASAFVKLFWETSISLFGLTPWSRVLLEKLISSFLVKKFSSFYGTQRFITSLSAHHLSLSWDRSIQSIPPHPTSWRSILILSPHLCLGLPSGLFPSGFSTKPLYMPLLSRIRATCWHFTVKMYHLQEKPPFALML